MLPGSWFHIVSTSTDGLVSAKARTLHSVVVGTEVAAQTLSLHDVAAEADVAAGNLVAVIKLDTRGTFQFGPAGVQLGRGLVAVLSGGAPDVTVIWS